MDAEQPVAQSREELIKLVARAHGDAPYAEATLAGKTLAASSKLPTKVAVNLGAGFGQWDFFPSAAEIVDFALGYVPPATPEDGMALARAWAADDAARRPTPLALVGREILQQELARFDLPNLRAAIDEVDPARARELRVACGLDVGPEVKGKAPAKRAAPRAKQPAAPPREIPTRMPKPEFKRPAPPPPAAAAKRFSHPKFGEGALVSQDGVGEDAKLTIKFASGPKTLLARFVTELP